MEDELIDPHPYVVIERISGVTSEILISYWVSKAYCHFSMLIFLGISENIKASQNREIRVLDSELPNSQT